jgi:hypothetical protein
VVLGGSDKPRVGDVRTTLTPNERAATPLSVPYLTLEALARQVLGNKRVAHTDATILLADSIWNTQ